MNTSGRGLHRCCIRNVSQRRQETLSGHPPTKPPRHGQSMRRARHCFAGSAAPCLPEAPAPPAQGVPAGGVGPAAAAPAATRRAPGQAAADQRAAARHAGRAPPGQRGAAACPVTVPVLLHACWQRADEHVPATRVPGRGVAGGLVRTWAAPAVKTLLCVVAGSPRCMRRWLFSRLRPWASASVVLLVPQWPAGLPKGQGLLSRRRPVAAPLWRRQSAVQLAPCARQSWELRRAASRARSASWSHGGWRTCPCAARAGRRRWMRSARCSRAHPPWRACLRRALTRRVLAVDVLLFMLDGLEVVGCRSQGSGGDVTAHAGIVSAEGA